MSAPEGPTQNRILTALPAEDFARLSPHLETVSLPGGQVLIWPNEPIDYVYFPHRAVVSCVVLLANGDTVEAGLIGGEGMVGSSIILGASTSPNQAIVQIPDGATRIPADILKAEFDRGG